MTSEIGIGAGPGRWPGRRVGDRSPRPSPSSILVLGALLLGAALIMGCRDGGEPEPPPAPVEVDLSGPITAARTFRDGLRAGDLDVLRGAITEDRLAEIEAEPGGLQGWAARHAALWPFGDGEPTMEQDPGAGGEAVVTIMTFPDGHAVAQAFRLVRDETGWRWAGAMP